MYRRYFLLCLICLPVWGWAQPVNDRFVRQFIEGYNAQDFGKMHQAMLPPLNWLLNKKRLKLMYGAQFEQLGKADIVTIQSKGANVVLTLRYERDTTETSQLGLGLGKKGKIIGLSSKDPVYTYPSSNTLPAPDAFTRIDSLVRYKHLAASFSGCVGVMENGVLRYQQCYGVANQVSKEPLQPSSVFELASCSKAFTAMGIVLLQESGKLKVTDYLSMYIPELAMYKGVTLEHLLTHTGGLPDYMELFEKHWDKTRIAQNEDVVQLLARYHPKKSFKPGTDYEYSNTGYALLAVVIERVSGLSFAAYMDRSIFQPLGMQATKVYHTRRSVGDTLPNYAYGYVNDFTNRRFMLPDSLPSYDFVRYLDGITGDGTVNSNLIDLAIWDRALRSERLVKKEVVEKIFSPYTLKDGELSSYGYGWEVQRKEGTTPFAEHSGGWPGYYTYVLRFLERPYTIVVLSNNEYIGVQALTHRIAAILNQR